MEKMGLLPKKNSKQSTKMGKEGGHVEEEETGLSVFLKKVEEVSGLIENLKTDVNKIKRLQQNILASPTPTEATKQELQSLTEAVQKTAFSVINVKLQEIGKYVLQQKKIVVGDEGPSVGMRIAQNQHAALSHHLRTLMEEVQMVQADYRDKCKERLLRQLQISGVGMQDLTSEQLDDMLDDDNCNVFTQGIIKDTAEAQRKLSEVTSRHDDIIRLEKSIRELHALTLEIGNLVEIQGETISHIEIHVTEARDQVDSGTKELKKAKKSQHSARRKKIYIITACLLIVAVIVLLIVYI